MQRAATPAIAALRAAGVHYEVLHYQHDPRSGSFGAEAVEQLTTTAGVDPWQIVKTLVIALPHGLAVAVLPVPATLSLKAAARAFGVPRAELADRAAAERSSGYVIGGISPFGQRRKLPTVVDVAVRRFDRVLCSAGKRGLDVAVDPQDLIRLTDAVTADISNR